MSGTKRRSEARTREERAGAPSARFPDLPILSALEEDDRQALLSEGAAETHYDKGQPIFREGDPARLWRV